VKHDPIASGKRKPLNLSIDTGVVEAARTEGVNLLRISEGALRLAARADRYARWKQENRAWIDAHQQWVEENELPLERYRLF